MSVRCGGGYTIYICVSALCDVRVTKSPNDAFLGTYPPRQAVCDCNLLFALSSCGSADVLEDNGRAARGRGEGRRQARGYTHQSTVA